MATIIVSSALLFIGFRLLNLILKKALYANKIKYHLSYILPIFEIIIWISVLIWFIETIYLTGDYYKLAFIGLLFLIIVFMVANMSRDFTYGIVLKSQNYLDEGTYIEIGEYKGIIKSAGFLMIEIIDNAGNITLIPYRSIKSGTIKKLSNNQSLEKIKLSFTFPENLKSKDIIEKLKFGVMNTPWTALCKTPVVEDVDTKDGKLVITIDLYCLDSSYGDNIKDMVETYIAIAN